jgi:membrane protein implicated in regulation of membrane protease activity
VDFNKYSVSDWTYGIATSLVAAVIFAAVVFLSRRLWRWIRNTSEESRRSDETERIIKIFVYRRYLQRTNVYSITRGQFFVITRFLRLCSGGLVLAAMGLLISWVTDIKIALYLFIGVGIWLFVEAASWLDPRWSKRGIANPDAQALADAAGILAESIEEVRSNIRPLPPSAPGDNGGLATSE